MRITKKQLREAKMRITACLANLAMYDHEKLKLLVKVGNPNISGFHPAGHCPNCGCPNDPADRKGPECKCHGAERLMAMSDCTIGQCIRILLLEEIEKQIPSAMVD